MAKGVVRRPSGGVAALEAKFASTANIVLPGKLIGADARADGYRLQAPADPRAIADTHA
jgi:hypothetical protein